MASGNWRLVTPPPEFIAAWREQQPDLEAPKVYASPNGLTAIMCREPVADDDLRWHISVRYGDPGVNGRIPTWDELVNTAHELRPGVPFVIGIPPRSWWINVHPHVLHLYETRDEALVATWREERMAHQPT